MKQVFAGRTVLFLCCLAGLAGASWGLFNSLSGLSDASNDVQMADMKVGWWFSVCNSDSIDCPKVCFPNCVSNNEWTIIDGIKYKGGCTNVGTGVCSGGGTYKVCGWTVCPWSWCEYSGRCGKQATPMCTPKTEGMTVIECEGKCEQSQTDCKKGC